MERGGEEEEVRRVVVVVEEEGEEREVEIKEAQKENDGRFGGLPPASGAAQRRSRAAASGRSTGSTDRSGARSEIAMPPQPITAAAPLSNGLHPRHGDIHHRSAFLRPSSAI